MVLCVDRNDDTQNFRMLSMNVSSTMVANASRTRNPEIPQGVSCTFVHPDVINTRNIVLPVSKYLNCELESPMPLARKISIAM